MRAAARFVGRADELATLTAVLARADAKHGTRRGAVVTIVGEPGAGKTALAEEATAGRRVTWARAREGGGAPPMWVWQQALGELGQALPSSYHSGDTGADRFQLFDAVARRLTELHFAEPLTIVLDDLQWADEESLAFVDFLAPDADQHGMVVLATVRRGELIPLPRSAVVIDLGGLLPDDVALMLTPATGRDQVDPDLIDAVWRHTGGNPFFIGEVDRLLRTIGRHADAGQWRSIVTEGVRSVLARRFARLPQRANRTLVAAAELGEAIDPQVLAAVLDRPVDDVLDDLSAATEAGLVRIIPDHGPAFGHSLVREAARAELPAGERRVLNQRAAQALADQHGERAAGQIAQYLLNVGDPEAGAWAEQAGETAYAASMYAESATWFQRAIERGPTDATSIRLRRAEALARCGRADEAEHEFLAVARAARTTGDVEVLARAALGVGSIGGGFEVRQLDPTQQALLREAIEALAGTESALRATLTARLSVAISLDGGHDERARLADEALAMARRVADDAAVAAALGGWCDAHAGPADIDARTVAATEMLVAAQRVGDGELELLARRLAIVASLEAGDIGRAERHAASFASLADRLRLPQFTWYARLIEGMLAHLHGDLDVAAARAAEAAELGRRVPSANARMLAEGGLAPIVDRDRGDPRWIDRAVRISAGMPEASRGHDLVAPFAVLTIGHGATSDEVASGLTVWEEMWHATWPHDGLALFSAFMLATGAAFTGDVDLIDELEPLLEPFADRFALDGTGSVCYGPISAPLAALGAARGETALATGRYRQAIAACRRIGAPLLQERFERDLARLGQPDRPAATSAVRRGTMRRDGEVWLVEFAGRETRLKHTKGLADLAALLARPDREVHVFDLVGVGGADRTDAGEVIDATAKAAYQQRIRALTAQIEAAEQDGRDERAAALDAERAKLITHLAGALGLGGRPRVAASDIERARKAVGMRLREACKRIDAELPELGRHLHSAVRTGTWCSYRTDTPVEWTLS